eukprot:CAMPEP_0180531660 /NCGR_PEP_ID=MMETSP1036_2-20121128/62621_1 /TAXON_ID=632150 /ORGANISM="Azadinium spinosum, Strain 3D9" /LENGTH=59 /DNA_ID=CAMNT_0022545643 /DNA_START=363 /DNA_END=542 /DNA_ORIENTATION=+
MAPNGRSSPDAVVPPSTLGSICAKGAADGEAGRREDKAPMAAQGCQQLARKEDTRHVYQ